jgi:hypothetical protein
VRRPVIYVVAVLAVAFSYLSGLSISVSPTSTDAVLRTIGIRLVHVDATGLAGLDTSAADPNAGVLALTAALIGVTFWLAWVTRDMARATKAIATTSAEEARAERQRLREAAEPSIHWEVLEYSQDRTSAEEFPFTALMVCRATNYGGPATIGRVEVPGGNGRVITPDRLLPTLGIHDLEVTMDIQATAGYITQRCKIVVVARPVAFAEWRRHEAVVLVRGPNRLESSGEIDTGATSAPLPPPETDHEVDLAILEPEPLKRR